MTNPPRNNPKKKLTIVASEKGVEIAEKALKRRGFNSKSDFSKSKFISRNTVSKFFNRQKIQLDTFKKICQELTLNWREVAGIEEGDPKQSNVSDGSSSEMNDGGGGAMQSILSCERRRVIVLDELSQVKKLEIILTGDIYSVENLKVLEFILREHSGNTIKIIDVKEGSIRLTVEGSQEDIERLLSKLQSGEIQEINGFPIEDFQASSERVEDEDNDEADDKWNLVREIVSRSVKNRNLAGADLSDADLSGANLRGADLIGADLIGADLIGADLIGADLIGANLIGADLSGADLSGADLRRAFVIGALVIGAFVIEASLSGALVIGALVIKANRRRADLRRAFLRRAFLRRADLRRADLSGANLKGANLKGADLSGANLSGANLSGANLSGADLSGADLSDADLIGANVQDAQFGNNIGIPEEMRADLTRRGAVFIDSPGSGDRIKTPIHR